MKGMHKGIGCVGGLLIAAAVFCSGQAMAADKIGVVDMRKVLSTSATGQKVQDAIEKKQRALQAELKKDEDALVALQKEGEKKNATWSEAVKKEKAAEFKKKLRDFNVKREKAGSELNKLRDEQLKPPERWPRTRTMTSSCPVRRSSSPRTAAIFPTWSCRK